MLGKGAGQAESDAATTKARQQTQTDEARTQAAQVALDKIRASLREP